MFQKPTFGGNTSGFGGFNAGASTSSPFGGFKPAAPTSAFGAAPAFGATAAPQPAAGGSFFGGTTASSGLFGASAAPATAPSFGGGTGGGFAFGQTSNTGTGLFGGTTAGSGLFGGTAAPQQNTSAFGAKPAGFGFASTATTGTTGGGLFGSTNTGGGLFGQQQNTTMGGGGLFGNTTGGFGQQQQQTGTAHVKYNPVVGTDVMVKSGQSQNISTKHHCITCMKEYEGKSVEELRLEDYMAGRKGGAANAGVFGGTKPLFGGSTAFGQPATTTAAAPSVFGGGGLGGGTFGQSSAFSFGQTAQAQNTTTNLFGANKPAFGATSTPGTTSLFGTTTTQAPAPAFGANTSAFGFGANSQNQSTGLFGAKPATTGFGAAPGGGLSMSGGGLFAPRPQQSAAPAFPSATPAFGTTAFGVNTSTTGSLFNNNFKPATAPAFGFGNTQPATGLGGLGGGLGTSFQAKPGGTGFPSLSTSGPSIFSGGQTAPTLNFNTGNTTLGGGLGGGLNLGGSLGMAQPMQANNLSGAASTGNVHEQILCLAARPYGDSPLFKNLLPDSSSTAEDVLKPTNPAAVQAVLAGSAYRVTSPEAGRLRVAPRAPHHAPDKKSLFDGLEESDPSLEDRLSLRPSRKRLVLRPQQNQDQRLSDGGNNRSPDEPAPPRSDRDSLPATNDPATNGSLTHKSPDVAREGAEVDGRRRSGEFADNMRGVNTDLEDSSERHGSWLGSSKLSWNNSKDKQIDIHPTPKLYPELDKELPEETSERRASWLTTKPLRKKTVQVSTVYQDSVRELRTERSESRLIESRIIHDKENIDQLSLSEEENVAPTEAPPHPAGIKLTRPGYYTIPSLEDMISYIRPDGSCVVPHLTIGRRNYGNVFYDGEIDVAGLDLDTLVHFLNKEVIIYPEDAAKPPVGEGLNRRAVVTLDRVWPRDKTEKRPVTDPERLMKMDYEGKLRRVCDKHDTKFIEYRPQTGSWVFRVEHFSKYGLTDSDEEDDITPDVLKRQLVNQSLQKNAAPAQKAHEVIQPSPGLGGLAAPEDNLFAMQQSTLNLLNGAGKAFEMDTTEDNAEIPSLYPQESFRAYHVKSPTSELARLEHRRSHNVQLMKASLYADMDMEDDVSVSTEDQLVPQPAALLTMSPLAPEPPAEDIIEETVAAPTLLSEELPMKPLLVRPHTIVLKYHRKVPPFKETIAGRLDAACIADMSVSRARHSRVGFAPANSLAFVTSRDALAHLPNVAALSSLNAYVSGRGEHDWSAPVVARLTLSAKENAQNVQDALAGHLEAMLDFSTFGESDESTCPQLSVQQSPAARRELLERHLREARRTQRRNTAFGVSGAYCLEVWKLCEALWAADLENDGVPDAGEAATVGRHQALLQWLAAAVADSTDAELAEPRPGEVEDEADGHSGRIWTLLLGGRLAEACRAARAAGDLNMAALLSQAAGDSAFRALVARQLSVWRECGADALISSSRRDALSLLAGEPPVAALSRADWLRSLHATARYLCPQVPTLEQIIQKYESLFTKSRTDEEDVDLTLADDDQCNDMQYPLPPYQADYDASIEMNGKKRRILDLRYELIRARALNSRPKLHPAAYTPDPMDYSLCFIVGAWLGNPSVESICGAAEQLEACGAWHLATAALAYHPDVKAREHLIRGVLSRHAPCSLDAPPHASRAALLARLRLPRRWLRLAQAARAKYEHKPQLEAEHLIAAGQYSAAHRVLLDELLPTAILADNLESIAPLVEQLNEAAQRHEVVGWESGGQALHHYLHVCTEIRDVVSLAEADRDRAGVHARLEALRPRVRAACRALAALPATSARHAAARAEMGARLLQSALAAGEPPARLAALLQALKLPPDCTWHAQLKITTELAQQASESCVESTDSSPISSHHQATSLKGQS